MFAKRIFLALIITAMMATVATAQSNEKHNIWEKLRRHEIVGSSAPPAQAPDKDTAPPTNKLEGTWLVTAVTVEDPSQTPFKVLFTFMAGRDENEGTSMDSNDGELAEPIVATPDQGTWKRTGDRRFLNTHLTFLFDNTNPAAGVPFGTAKVRDVITLNKQGNEFSGRQFVEVFDTHGNLLFAFNVLMNGVRVRAEEPPPLP